MTETEAVQQPNGVHQKKRHEEYQYLELIRDILANGEHRPDR